MNGSGSNKKKREFLELDRACAAGCVTLCAADKNLQHLIPAYKQWYLDCDKELSEYMEYPSEKTR